jgi:hypothetical protein
MCVGRPRRRWKDNIKMDLKEIGWDVVCWIQQAWDRGPGTESCEHGDDPSGTAKCQEFFEKLGFSRSALPHYVMKMYGGVEV